MRSGVIIGSKIEAYDAVPDGVYLTSLPPSTGKTEIAKNNWDDRRSFVVRNLEAGNLHKQFTFSISALS